MQTLTLEAVRTAGQAAYEAKQLSAQGPTASCRYRDASGCPCVVGAALDEETVDEIVLRDLNSFPVVSLKGRNIISYAAAESLEIEELQAAHDEWAKIVVDTESTSHQIELAEKEFVALLYKKD